MANFSQKCHKKLEENGEKWGKMGKNGEFILWGIGKTDWEIPHFSPLVPPRPLDISESYSPDLYLKVGFYLINIVPVQSYRSLKIAHSCDSCQPLYIRAAM